MKNIASHGLQLYGKEFICFWRKKNRVLAALRSYTNTLYHHPKEAKSIIAEPPGERNREGSVGWKIFCKNLLTFAYHKCYTFGKQKVVVIWSPRKWADLLTHQNKPSWE